MPTPTIRVLLAEDYQPFRRLLSSTIQIKFGWNDIHEVADGSDAVRKAQELHPELILLDIGLPKLNGIAAAREIKKISPASNILFVSQEASAEIVYEALKTGAEGYLCKMDAGSELVAAIEAVVQGKRYVSKSLTPALASNLGASETAVVTAHPVEINNLRHHEAAFYSDNQSLIDGFARFAETALKRGNATIVVASESHQTGLLAKLYASDVNMKAAIEQGRYVSVNPPETLASFMVDGLPDRARFQKIAVDLIIKTAETVGGDTTRVVACGECAPILWQGGNAEGAILLEHLWDEVAKSYGVQILCGYLLPSFQGGVGSFVFERICKEHSTVLSR